MLFGLCLVAALVYLRPSRSGSEPTSSTAGRDDTSDGAKGHAPGGPQAPKGGTPEPKVEPKGGDTRAVEISNRVKMVFCYIPRGKATLGSPKEEKGHAFEEVEHEFISPGYWLGKYEVTQAEWMAVMDGKNPSEFDGQKDNKAKGMDTSRFPVENVSWDMICEIGRAHV